MSEAYAVDEIRRDIDSLNDSDVKDGFRLDYYMKTHPRMTKDTVVKVMLDVKDSFMDVVRQEFYVDRVYRGIRALAACGKPCDGYTRLKVTSCRKALSNWLKNVPELARLVEGDQSGVREEMIRRAREVLKVYGGGGGELAYFISQYLIYIVGFLSDTIVLTNKQAVLLVVREVDLLLVASRC